MSVTCVITGYKLTAGTIIVYGFILSGTVFYPPTPTPTTNMTATTERPTESTVVDITPTQKTTPTTTKTTDLPTEFTQCGIPSTKPITSERSFDTPVARMLMSIVTGRILGGTITNEGDWPWMVYLFEKPLGRRKGFICGGALINKQWVVTAAHCINQPNSPNIYGVTLGEHTVSSRSIHELVSNVVKIIRHRDYFRPSNNNDIALLKISRPVQFTRYVRPICLLPQGFPTDSTESIKFQGNTFSYAGRICTVLGWGTTGFGNRSDIMQQVNVIILPHVLCTSSTKIPSSKPYDFRPVEEDDPKFCAGGALGEDTCDGDSGGPLLCINEDGRYYLHGITSYGTTPCGQKNLPGVYTRAADFSDWIMKNID